MSMKKYIGVFSILIGIFTSISTFSYSGSLSTLIALELIGIAISVFAWKKYNEKIISSIGLALNAIPLAFIALTFLFLA